MNSAPDRAGSAPWAYALATLGALLIVAALAWAMHGYTQPTPLGEDRAAARAQALAELRAAEAQALANPGWVDPTKGIVRLPIENALVLAAREWGRDPAAARSNLIQRAEKAFAAPPKTPAKPSEFE
jgi:hypothetical protein